MKSTPFSGSSTEKMINGNITVDESGSKWCLLQFKLLVFLPSSQIHGRDAVWLPHLPKAVPSPPSRRPWAEEGPGNFGTKAWRPWKTSKTSETRKVWTEVTRFFKTSLFQVMVCIIPNLGNFWVWEIGISTCWSGFVIPDFWLKRVRVSIRNGHGSTMSSTLQNAYMCSRPGKNHRWYWNWDGHLLQV